MKSEKLKNKNEKYKLKKSEPLGSDYFSLAESSGFEPERQFPTLRP